MDLVQVDNSTGQYSINIEEVMDYNYCSMYYKLKHENPGIENMTETYDRLLRMCFYSYLNLLKNKSSVDLGHLTRLWGKHWIKGKSMVKIMTMPSANTRDTYDRLRKNGIDTLLSFHDLMKEGSQYPILINKGYNIKIDNNITLNGRWEYIRELKLKDNSNVFQIIKFTHKKDKFQTLMQMRHDIELTAADYAFKQMFTATESQVVYANIYKERMVPSYRDERDYATLKQTIKNTITCIANNIYSISPDVKCYHCTYRNQCEDFINQKKG